MNQSNIFAYVELGKLVSVLESTDQPDNLEQKLRSQSAYFTIIDPKYFSDVLRPQWIQIQHNTSMKGAVVDADGYVISNATNNTLNNFTQRESYALAEQIKKLYKSLRLEFEGAAH